MRPVLCKFRNAHCISNYYLHAPLSALLSHVLPACQSQVNLLIDLRATDVGIWIPMYVVEKRGVFVWIWPLTLLFMLIARMFLGKESCVSFEQAKRGEEEWKRISLETEILLHFYASLLSFSFSFLHLRSLFANITSRHVVNLWTTKLFQLFPLWQI